MTNLTTTTASDMTTSTDHNDGEEKLSMPVCETCVHYAHESCYVNPPTQESGCVPCDPQRLMCGQYMDRDQFLCALEEETDLDESEVDDRDPGEEEVCS